MLKMILTLVFLALIDGCVVAAELQRTESGFLSDVDTMTPKVYSKVPTLREDPKGYVSRPDLTSNFAEFAAELKEEATQGDAEAQYNLGRMYFEGSGMSEDFVEATVWLEKAAEQGVAKAQFYLGWTYLKIALKTKIKLLIGVGSEDAYYQYQKIEQKAAKWLNVAFPKLRTLARKEDAEAQDMLSKMYKGWGDIIENEDLAAMWRRKAIENFKKAAEQGDTISQYRLGLHYTLEKDYANAIKWYTKTAKRGHFEAQCELAHIFDSVGWGAAYAAEIRPFHDDIEAVKWYKRAAQRSYAKAQYMLANSYMYNEKVKDCNEALKWYTKSAEQGYHKAQEALAYMYYLGEDVAQDNKKAFKWFSKIAERGDVLAQEQLGSIYYYGWGVGKDYKEAFKWYTKAAEKGNTSSQYSLGKMYYKGEATTKNYPKAAALYREAAEKGYDLAQFCLAQMHYRGEGVVQNYVDAYMWAILAAVKDNEHYVRFRDMVKEKMTAEQIAEGQKKAKEFHDKLISQKRQMLRLFKSLGTKEE